MNKNTKLSKKAVASLGGKARAELQKKESVQRYYENPVICKNCLLPIQLNERKPSEVRKLKFCNNSCSATFSNRTRVRIKKTISCKVPKTSTLDVSTKADVFSRCSSWQSARSYIRKNACDIINKSQKPKKCFICGYSTFVEVCHIKPVALFTDDTKISVINKIDNLVYLCPNHHKEFDKGLIILLEDGMVS